MKYLKTIERSFGYLAEEHGAKIQRTPNGILWFHDTETNEVFVLKDNKTMIVKDRNTGEMNTIMIPRPAPGGWEE